MTLLERFLNEFDQAENRNMNFVAIQVVNADSSPEVIINPNSNFKAKKDYYALAYDNDLRLKANPSIQIVHWVFEDHFSEIQFRMGLDD